MMRFSAPSRRAFSVALAGPAVWNSLYRDPVIGRDGQLQSCCENVFVLDILAHLAHYGCYDDALY